jgi:hypothetical protein
MLLYQRQRAMKAGQGIISFSGNIEEILNPHARRVDTQPPSSSPTAQPLPTPRLAKPAGKPCPRKEHVLPTANRQIKIIVAIPSKPKSQTDATDQPTTDQPTTDQPATDQVATKDSKPNEAKDNNNADAINDEDDEGESESVVTEQVEEKADNKEEKTIIGNGLGPAERWAAMVGRHARPPPPPLRHPPPLPPRPVVSDAVTTDESDSSTELDVLDTDEFPSLPKMPLTPTKIVTLSPPQKLELNAALSPPQKSEPGMESMMTVKTSSTVDVAASDFAAVLESMDQRVELNHGKRAPFCSLINETSV